MGEATASSLDANENYKFAKTSGSSRHSWERRWQETENLKQEKKLGDVSEKGTIYIKGQNQNKLERRGKKDFPKI